MATATPKQAEQRTPPWAKPLAILAALAVVPGGAFLAIAYIGTGGKVAIAAGVVWWLIASAVIGKTALRRWPDLRTPVRAALALAAVASIATAYIASRPTTADEDIVTGAPAQKAPKGASVPAAPRRNVELLSGRFSGQSGHSGEGRAAVVELRGGRRVLTFSRFDVDPGAGGLRIYLHAGRTTSDDLGDYVELAGLKGTRGDQQYRLPADLDLKRYSSVVIWCVPFSTRIAEAPLS